jgi:hypothetical protein
MSKSWALQKCIRDIWSRSLIWRDGERKAENEYSFSNDPGIRMKNQD